MDKELLCYCIIGKDNKNTACKLNCEDYTRWKERYRMSLESYIAIEKKPLDVRRYYFDPDGAYIEGKNHLFFEHLVEFLRKSEKCFKDKLKGHFSYELAVGEGIIVFGKDENGVDRKFHLRSDQLGFSAPTNDKLHPYDLFIEKSENKEDAIIQVCSWVSKTRTIGGSFLWPMPFYEKYNLNRGGKITSNRRYYIQDRVDLTLQEIQNWYLRDAGNPDVGKHDILYNYNKTNLDIWLHHFNDFNTYVDFFCFDDFVEKIEGKQKIKRIISETEDIPGISANVKNRKPEITREMDYSQLYDMLNRLSNLVEERSKKMIERVCEESR